MPTHDTTHIPEGLVHHSLGVDGWRETTLGEVVDYVLDNRGKTPPITESGYELLEVNAISEVMREPDYTKVSKFVDEETFKTWFRKGTIQEGDVLIPTVGTIGNAAYSRQNRGAIAQNLIALRTNNDNSSLFLYYFLTNPITKRALLNLDIGGVQPSIKVPHLLDMRAVFPPLPEQRAIADMLSSLDAKIELLREQNETLEKTAQTIFQEWFGRYSVESPEELPEGWRVGKLGDVVKFQQGTQVPSENQSQYLDESKDRFLRIVDYMSNFTEPPRFIPKNPKNSYCNENEIIMVRYGEVGFIGRRAIGVFANNLFKIIPTSVIDNNFLYYLLKQKTIQEYIKNNSAGSALPAITHGTVGNIQIVIPTEDIVKGFSIIAESFESKIQTNSSQIQSLSKTRDILLPKLMSGEVNINN